MWVRIDCHSKFTMIDKKFWIVINDFIGVISFSGTRATLFLKMCHPRPLFRLFSTFQTNTTILTTNIREKML